MQLSQRKCQVLFSRKNNKGENFRILSATTLHIITKTRQYHFDPLKPHFYIVKLGFTGVDIIFLISDQNIDYEYLLELPR